MLEAMYMGLPVIVTNRVGLWPQVEEQKCGLVVPLDENQLFEALSQMAHTNNRVEMGQRGHELVASQYTWDIVARDLITKIETLTT